MFGHLTTAGRRKLGLGEEWDSFAWRGVGKDNILKFGVPAVSKKGKRRWPKPHVEVVVTQAEEVAERLSYETSTGNCATCLGSGKIAGAWSREKGLSFRDCFKCGGSGKPTATARAEA
jgi:hypothetical protein